MGFSLGKLDLGGVLAGFAERDMELRDKAREDSLKLARDTLNFRAELGMSRRKEKQAELKSAVSLGRRLMQNHNFTMQQVGALASQGKLDQVAELYDRAQTDPNFKGELPDANTVVTLMEEKPVDMPFEQYMRNIVIGEVDTSRSFERDIGAGAEPSDAFFRLTGFDPYSDARKYQSEYEKSLGMSADELGAYAFDGFVPEQVQGQVDITGFKPADSSKFRVDFKDATKSIGADLATAMGLESNFQYGEFLGVMERGERALQHSKLTEEGASKVVNIMRDEGLDYDQALSRVKAEMFTPEKTVQYRGGASSVRTDGGGATGFMDEETVRLINEAPDDVSLRKIVADISSRPAAREEKRRISEITRNKTLSLDEMKRQIIEGSSASDPVIEETESPALRYDKRGRPVQKGETAMADEAPSPEEVATARRELEARGVDTMDKNAIKTAMLAQTKPMVDAQRKEFVGTDREFFQMLGQEYDALAQAIIDDAQGGLV